MAGNLSTQFGMNSSSSLVLIPLEAHFCDLSVRLRTKDALDVFWVCLFCMSDEMGLSGVTV